MKEEEIIRESDYACLYRVFLGLTPSGKRRRFDYYVVDYIDKRQNNAYDFYCGRSRSYAIFQYNYADEYYRYGVEAAEEYAEEYWKKRNCKKRNRKEERT